MAYLLTGICGNAGQYVAAQLLASGFDVIGVDVKTYHNKRTFSALQHLEKTLEKNSEKDSSKKSPSLRIHWIDLTDFAALENVFIDNQQQLKGVLHLAFILPPFSEFNPEKSHDINMKSMNNLISLTEKFAPTVPFVFASSSTVFAPPKTPTSIIGVNWPVEGTSQYIKDKIDCETLLHQSKLDWRILRLSVVMVPSFRPKQESIDYGLLIALDTLVEPIHAKDVAIAFEHALTSPEVSHKTCIIAGGERTRMTYKDYVLGTLQAAIPNLTVDDVPWDSFSGKKKHYLHWYDTKESQLLLKFQQRTFNDYCIDMKNQLHWWEKLGAYLFGKKMVKRYFKKH